MSQPSFTQLPPGQGTGLAAVAVFSFISALSVIIFLLRAIWVSVSPMWSRKASKEVWLFFHTQLGMYAACLLLGNLVFSMGGILNFAWAMEDGVTENATCKSQAIFTQIGNFANAYFLVTIGVHTVTSLIFGRRQPIWFSGVVIFIGWAAALLVAILPVNVFVPKLGPFYGNAGYGCWITEDYPGARFYLHYLFIFLAGIIAAILYSLIFLSLRGTLHLRGGFSFTLDPTKRWNGRVGTSDEYRRFIHSIARSMLWYPLGYIVCFTPVTATMLFQMSNFDVPFGFSVFAAIFSDMQGFINVLILYNTIRVLQPAFIGLSSSQRSDVESGGSSAEKSLISEKGRSRVPESRRRSGQGIAPYLASQAAGEPMPWGVQATPALQQPKLAHQRSFSTVSASSGGSGSPFVGTHARMASYDTMRSASTIGRSITPTSQLERPIIEFTDDIVNKANPIAHPHLRVVTEHQHHGSGDSLGLPPAPRRSRSPINRHPSLSASSSPDSSSSSPSSGVSAGEHRESLYSMYHPRTPADKDRFSAAPLPALPSRPDRVKRKPSMLRSNALSPIDSSEASEYSEESAGVSPNIFGTFKPETARPPTQYAEYDDSATSGAYKGPNSAFGSYKSSHSHLHGSGTGNAF